ncbi:glycoside hydrolase family 32 protein [Mediterraneibacter glycyrrhizinilyticus]|nr:glycoside hydrolase family 32 protein [Mediterraneibacter glycyrrhizinilyticus]MBM6801443.1 glycoside hydrolase family 32 protein [Mediterraneibacter glycyrrhizinilyticus]
MKRQTLHLKAPDNWVNDPNGFIYYKGYYHLFYQYFPYEPRWGTMHWGHAVSSDLVTWEHKGLALYPITRADQNGCFSGSAIEEDGKLYLVYTGVCYEVVNPDDPHSCLNEQFESAQLMISSEDGYNFDNEHGKEMIISPVTDPSIGDRTHTRDPKVWRGEDAWYLILGSTVEEKYGEVLMLSAMKLLPDHVKERNQSICFPVTFDEASCRLQIPDAYQYLDYGLDLYAPQTTLDKDGLRTMIAWVRMPKVTEEGWIGMFCSPRVVDVENGHIFFRLHPNIRNAYSRAVRNVKDVSDDGYMASFDLEDGETADIGGFIISRKGNSIVTDRSSVYPAFEGAHLISETPELKGGCHLDVLVDPHLIEVYINDGEYVISNAVYDLGDKIRCDKDKDILLYTTA